jgi:hypothetical protein
MPKRKSPCREGNQSPILQSVYDPDTAENTHVKSYGKTSDTNHGIAFPLGISHVTFGSLQRHSLEDDLRDEWRA